MQELRRPQRATICCFSVPYICWRTIQKSASRSQVSGQSHEISLMKDIKVIQTSRAILNEEWKGKKHESGCNHMFPRWHGWTWRKIRVALWIRITAKKRPFSRAQHVWAAIQTLAIQRFGKIPLKLSNRQGICLHSVICHPVFDLCLHNLLLQALGYL